MSVLNSTIASRTLVSTALILLLISCHRFFMPVQQNTGSPAASGNYIAANSQQKYFILRKGVNSYAIRDIIVDQQAMTLSGHLSPVPAEHQLYLNAEKSKMRYKDNEGGNILNEIHIYVQDKSVIDTQGQFTLPLDQIVRIEVIQHDRKRTTSSYVLGGIGIGLGVMVLAGVIIALTKSSCPFISVYDGQQYNLQGELFGGAVNHTLERTDYVPLQATAHNGRFELRISNELRERQYTNFANLLLVEHPAGIQVLPGENGELYSTGSTVKPATALLNDRISVLDEIRNKDDKYCGFNDSSTHTGINELLLTFPNQSNRKEAKLVLQLKNAYWFDYLYGEFTRQFGSSYSSWQEQQKTRPAAEMIRWTEEQSIPVKVTVLTGKGWQEITRIKTVGPLAQRRLVIPLPSADLKDEKIQVKLSTGFMFWELDEVSMDFTADNRYPVTRLRPVTAIDENGVSVINELREDDSLYLRQPLPGNYATITYNWNRQPATGNVYSIILHTKGYYEPVREYSGTPATNELKKFREPGALARFSLSRYQQIPKEHQVIALETR
jgi:hypothetical protein